MAKQLIAKRQESAPVKYPTFIEIEDVKKEPSIFRRIYAFFDLNKSDVPRRTDINNRMQKILS